MSIFHRLGRTIDEPQLSPELKKRLDELDEQNRKLNKRVDVLELDWSEWFDKFRVMYARLSKRIKDAAQVDGNGAQSPQDAPETTNDRVPGYGHPPLHERARRNY